MAKQTSNINLRLTPPLFKEIHKEAHKRDMTVSDYVRLCCLIGSYVMGQKVYSKAALRRMPLFVIEYFEDAIKDFEANFSVDEKGQHLIITNKSGVKIENPEL